MKRNPATGDGGFTLLEVLVALAIVAVAVTLVLQLFSSNLRALSVSGGALAASARADARMREILTESQLTVSVWSEEKEAGYPMEIAVGEALPERMENLPVRLLTVDLTVRWREGAGEKRLTLQTMKVVERK